MSVLIGSHEAFFSHDTGRRHPERPGRLEAVRRGVAASGVAGDVAGFEPREATDEELGRVHDAGYALAVRDFCAGGGGFLDQDTIASPGSFDAALRAAGAGPDAAERLRAGAAVAAFLALRPPGHHARPGRAMGFCLFNNVAVTAATLAAAGERVAVVDWDAHHGNGTQEIFYARGDVLYVSIHQFPCYPGTGSLAETGTGPGAGATVNLPLPAGSAGDAYREAIDTVVTPLVERFEPAWVLVSAGFDGHRDDPLTDLGLSAGDYADLTALTVRLAPPGRRIVFLEGGYDLAALEASTAATVAALDGERLLPEAATSAGTAAASAARAVAAARRLYLGS
ncbi:MAG: histone deacetylase family protein [Acidimicrobiales bacterium]